MDRTGNIVEFTGAAFDTRSLPFVALTKSTWALFTLSGIHITRTIFANITKFTPNAVRSSATHSAFGTAVFGRPTNWTLDATAVSTFSTKVCCI